MNRVRLSLGIIATSIAASAYAQNAPHARVTRNAGPTVIIPQTWVSGAGSDGNDCTRTTPCATFAVALAVTLPGGQVTALDSGDFGPLTITQSVTISGSGGQISSASASSGAAITITAGATDTVTLRNLDLNGLGQSYGVLVNSAKAVHIENLRVIGFGTAGVRVQNSSNAIVTVHDSTISNNRFGLLVQGASSTAVASVLIAHSHFAQQDISVYDAGNANVTVTDSDVARGLIGYEATQAGAVMNLVRSKAAYESTAGVQSDATGVISMSDLTLANSGFAGKANSGGQLISFGNNAFTNAIAPTSTVPLQ